MSVVKTCIQIAVTEDVTAELIRILTQFIMKYHIFQDSQGSFIQNYHQPLSILLEISNPEYHKLKGRPPKQYRSVVENNHITSGKSNDATVQKTCSYCSRKRHNI
ncbi:unnamed protein product [Rhizophagus irregularis]|nr:unnamed protein product [Rhizophagus irregularis]